MASKETNEFLLERTLYDIGLKLNYRVIFNWYSIQLYDKLNWNSLQYRERV